MITRGDHRMITHEMAAKDDDQQAEWEHFLGLHRRKIRYDNGYWATFRVMRVEPDEGRPHGWQYSLTLHDEDDDRILGFDNAHPVDVAKSGPSKRSRRPKTFDHIDRRGKRSVPYNFESPYKLLADFFDAVDRILKEEGVRDEADFTYRDRS